MISKKRIAYGWMAVVGTVIFLLSFIPFNGEDPEMTPYVLEIPQGFPQPEFPKNNALTQERVELGRMLFYDPVLSIDSTVSCASCHNQSLAFADDKKISPGVEGRLAARNAPTLTNVVYNPTVLFDGYLPTLEMQILVPIQEHAEFDFNIVDLSQRLNNNPDYVKRSVQAYGRKPDPYVITRSIASFERILISGNSTFDQQVYQGKNVMNRSEKRGMKLFFEELECAKCHSGFNFTSFETKNNGLYLNYPDSGRARATHLPEDKAVFKIPTLRNIALTAPYMHDGSIPDLEGVIEHYMSGGAAHPNKSDLIQPFTLSERQKQDLIHFLETLTDKDFLNNPAFANPF